uniref:Uncharacterized protein n=1 Tax=Arundo donax TaxID=35708 RepID=A0A0A8XRH8_ARUDO
MGGNWPPISCLQSRSPETPGIRSESNLHLHGSEIPPWSRPISKIQS